MARNNYSYEKRQKELLKKKKKEEKQLRKRQAKENVAVSESETASPSDE